eukprot:1287298-Prymnesium_polylepis.1
MEVWHGNHAGAQPRREKIGDVEDATSPNKDFKKEVKGVIPGCENGSRSPQTDAALRECCGSPERLSRCEGLTRARGARARARRPRVPKGCDRGVWQIGLRRRLDVCDPRAAGEPGDARAGHARDAAGRPDGAARLPRAGGRRAAGLHRLHPQQAQPVRREPLGQRGRQPEQGARCAAGLEPGVSRQGRPAGGRGHAREAGLQRARAGRARLVWRVDVDDVRFYRRRLLKGAPSAARE